MVSSSISRWLDVLLAPSPNSVSLNDIGEAIGSDAASTDDIQALFEQLEQRGIAIRAETRNSPQENLRTVLLAARNLKQAGKAPNTFEIARETGLSPEAVRGALLFAQVLQR